MHNKKVKHNKLRNTGLLFEFLLRQTTADVLNKEKECQALNIIKKRFNENTELGKEWALYNLLINRKFDSDKKANFFILEAIDARKKINISLLKREKFNLIKEIQKKYNLVKFLSSKVPNYKIYASVYMLFEQQNRLSPAEKTESFFNLVENITSKENIKLSETIGLALPDDEELRILTYRVLLEKFNQKYSHLDSNQKKLLRSYINNISNTNSLKEYVENEIPHVKKNLKQYSKKIDDKITKIKLNEAMKSINKFCNIGNSKVVNDTVVIQLMRYYELIKELKKV